jgi:Tol biopolymer transport system component
MVNAEHALQLVLRTGGDPTDAITQRGPFAAPAIAPAGARRVALQVMGPTDQLWVHDLDTRAATQLTFHADNACPIWSPDGESLAFRSNMGGRPELYMMPADGSEPPELLLGAEGSPTPTGFSPDGSLLLFTRMRPTGGMEVWSVKVGEPASARPVVQVAAGAWGGTISPDGKFLAFVSEQTGRAEVYVQPMAAAGAPNPQRWQVTSDGGQAPVWSRAGGELFYRTHEAVICSRVAVEPTFQLGRARVVAQGVFVAPTALRTNYDATADGQGVVVLRSSEDEQPVQELRVILNWFDELRRLSPHPQQVKIAPTSKIIPPRPSYNSSAGTMA